MCAKPLGQRRRVWRWAVLIIILPIFLIEGLTACRAAGEPPSPGGDVTPGETGTPVEAPTDTPVPPTVTPSPTPVPLAATVNGEPILLSVYEASLARFNAAQALLGTELAPEEAARQVLDDLINQQLLVQAATGAGYRVDEAEIDRRVAGLVAEIGGPEALDGWLEANFYTGDTFREDLGLALAAAWMRDEITAGVPETAEQVYARQILLYNAGDAEDILAQLQAGADFDALARAVDPQGYGDLGWFPQGYLTEPAIEEVAFSLQPGEYSEIIETRLGYHIVMVEDRLPDRPLDPAARLALQYQVFEAWLEERRAQSEIVFLLP